MVKNFLYGLFGFIALVLIVGTLAFWGAPMTENNASDLAVVTVALSERDSVEVTNVTMSPLEEMTIDGRRVDVQTVKYTADSLDKAAIIEVKKGFLKYHFVGIYE